MKKMIVASIIAGMCLAGCGEAISQVKDYTNECPMTFEEDFYVPVALLEGEVESMAYEWESNPNTHTETSIIDDDIWELEVYEDGCNTHTYYYFGTH
jgi:hypothetical protein